MADRKDAFVGIDVAKLKNAIATSADAYGPLVWLFLLLLIAMPFDGEEHARA